MLVSRNVLVSVALLLTALLGGCDDDDEYLVSVYGPLVGGPCTDDLDCHSGSFCADSSDFPEGTCTVPCDDHNECPGPSLCIARERGACLLACTRDSDCRGGYQCKDIDDQAGSGKSMVCIK
jgi:hypothetical protein